MTDTVEAIVAEMRDTNESVRIGGRGDYPDALIADWADRLQSAHDAEVGALREDAAKWRNYCTGRAAADTSHVCRACGHPYTPEEGESEDCPKCGHDGGAMEGEDG